jgi:Xaa-Pro aminopeptidase
MSAGVAAQADPTISGGRAEEVARKLEAVRAWLSGRDLDGVLIGSQPGFAWVTAGGRSHISIGDSSGVASVLVTSDRTYLLTTNIEVARLVEEEIGGLPFEPVSYPWHQPDGLEHTVRSVSDPAGLVSDLAASSLTVAGEDFVRLRFTLQPPEVERYRALGGDAAQAVETACREARPGDTEHDVAARIAYEAVRRDILPLVNLVAADDRIAAYRHPLPTGNRIRRTLLAALTGRRHGLHASLTRMVSFGEPDPDLTGRHAAVRRVDTTVLLASRPGATLGDVVRASTQRYEAEGFPREWELHHQGGLTGYGGREIFGTPDEPHALEASQAVAWNPSITRVKSEDTAVVTASGVEILTRTTDWPQLPTHVPAGGIDRPALLVKGA